MIDEDRSAWTSGQLADEVIEACELPMGCRGTIMAALDDARDQGRAESDSYAERITTAARAMIAAMDADYPDGNVARDRAALEGLRAALAENPMRADRAAQEDRAIESGNFPSQYSARERAKDKAAMELTAALAQMAPGYEADETEFLNRDRVMELVTRWRMKWDAASQSKNEQGKCGGASIDKVKSAYVECIKARDLIASHDPAFQHVSRAGVLLYDAYEEWFRGEPQSRHAIGLDK